MQQSNRTRAHGSAQQTIEQIEAQAAEVRAAEREAMGKLAEVLRELAVELPPESRLPVQLASAAKTIDLFQRGAHPDIGLMDVPELVEAWGVEACATLARKLEVANIIRRR